MWFKSNKLIFELIKVSGPYRMQLKTFATRKRFYRNTGIVQNENKWEVTLDHRRLKTPNGKVLTVPTEPLARAIAVEWDAQTDVIAQPVMHLTALCNTALDNPGKLTKHDIVNHILDYLPTDALLFHSDEQPELREFQEKKWSPILDWFQERFEVKQEISMALEPPPVSTQTRAVIARYLLSYDFVALNAIYFGVEALKSPILMMACIERRLDPHEAVMLSRLEEEFQLQQWGRVAWAHELSQVDLTSRVSAALLVVHSMAEKHTAVSKTSPNQQHDTYAMNVKHVG